tara:strand:- start:1139 stop:1696 length:558 start_codon:yes stop_codon:yes gene_type:complete
MIQIENTPNPNALKFLSDDIISEVGTKEFQKNKISEIKNNFVKSLLNIDGVELILLSDNFLSVKKQEKANWESIKPSIISYLNDYFKANKKPILAKKETNESKIKSKKDHGEIVDQINEILESKIRPAVARDGGDIQFVSFEKGVVKVNLRGSCSGCPSSMMTLKKGVENLLKHYVKGVKSVEAT